jgi:hypothetical protein
VKIEQRKWNDAKGWSPGLPPSAHKAFQLAFVFGAVSTLRHPRLAPAIRSAYPGALVFGCSTAGEIAGDEVCDDCAIVTAIQLERSQFRAAETAVLHSADSFDAGETIAQQLPPSVPDALDGTDLPLAHVIALTDGLDVNGSEFVAGLARHLPEGVTITGGMAGDGVRFGETLVFRRGIAAPRAIAAIGLYGSHLKIGFGSLGGWDVFGPERTITRSAGNVLYELDGEPALERYKSYLGGAAQGLPATGLLFPLSVKMRKNEPPVVRTILAVDETEQSITFAGDMPEGAHAQLMKANFERLLDGAAGAARVCQAALKDSEPEFALLISCVGRRLVLKERVAEEVRAVRNVLGACPTIACFYSYGEISPFTPGARCELHNQTMTITTLSER